MTSSSFDIVSVGAGHNNLVAAAYLAKAGQSVLVLERNAHAGGGVVTQELSAPGFLHDTHSTAHIMVLANPLFVNDELQLRSKFGLEYLHPDAPFGTSFDDGTALITYRSIDKTVESIAQFSKVDAEAYRRFAEMAVRTVPMFAASMFTPPLPVGGMVAMMDQSPGGREILQMMLKSSWDIVNEWFSGDKLKIHFLKFVSNNLQGPEEKGTGIGLLVMVGMTHTTGIGLPKGGSGKLTEALVRCIQHHGGQVLTGRHVKQLLRRSDRVVGVETDQGERFTARRAVIGAIHPHLLRDYFPDADEAVLRRADQVQVSPFSALNTHYALHERIHFRSENERLRQAYMIEMVPQDMERFRRCFDQLRYQRMPQPIPTFGGGTQSLADPSRAPAGKSVFYFTTLAPYNLEGRGGAYWDQVKDRFADQMLRDVTPWIDNVTPDNVIARCVHSPADIERSSPSFQQGDFMGAAPYFFQMNGHRPTPDLARYTVPGIEGFYLVGPFMHPGGGVFGAGRGTAIRMFEDLGLDFERVHG